MSSSFTIQFDKWLLPLSRPTADSICREDYGAKDLFPVGGASGDHLGTLITDVPGGTSW